jgi:hypothetical protein
MSDIALDQTEEILAYDVSDEALETAAGTGTKLRGTTRFITALL